VYLTLKEALEKRLLVIKEVSVEASMPELKVINNADVQVLLLDGEELACAKQNRVLKNMRDGPHFPNRKFNGNQCVLIWKI